MNLLETLIEVSEIANAALLNLLPSISKMENDIKYPFKEWFINKKVVKHIKNVFLAYFSKSWNDIKLSASWLEYSVVEASGVCPKKF